MPAARLAKNSRSQARPRTVRPRPTNPRRRKTADHGVGAPPHPDYDMADWVLSTFKNQDAADMESAALRAADAIECCVRDGLDKAMNQYNS